MSRNDNSLTVEGSNMSTSSKEEATLVNQVLLISY